MGKPIRICILTTLFYPIVGGAEIHNRALVERLIEREIDVFVITRRTEAKLKSQELVGKILVFRLPPTGFKRSSKYWMMSRALWFLLENRRWFDILYVAGYPLLGVVAVLSSSRMPQGLQR